LANEKPIHIPLPPDVAIAEFLKVKPTADMPRPGKRKTKPTKKPKKGTR